MEHYTYSMLFWSMNLIALTVCCFKEEYKAEVINTDVSKTDEPVDPFGIEAFPGKPVEGIYAMSFDTSSV